MDNNQQQSSQGAQQGQGSGQQSQDYGDKAFGFIAKKTGYNVDPNTGEKITDGLRSAFEKATGKKVDPKYSN